MNKMSNSRTSLFFSLFSAIAFGAVAFLMKSGSISAFERSVIHALQSLESELWTSVMKLFSSISSGIPVGVIIVVVCLYFIFMKRQARDAVLFLSALAGSLLLNLVLKNVFQRERPDFYRIIEEDGFSFPSGNAMIAFALFGILTYFIWQHIHSRIGRIVLLLMSFCLITAVGASRVYLGVHYPSDILSGYLASGFWIGVCIYFYQQKSERKVVYTGKPM
ncbi:phosphatase PAP2 family protein [Neobacillus mesonae]|nr:phosphatase PAP2 family protein [Neobacillus mesonae]